MGRIVGGLPPGGTGPVEKNQTSERSAVSSRARLGVQGPDVTWMARVGERTFRVDLACDARLPLSAARL
jgi:hypothetical protein